MKSIFISNSSNFGKNDVWLVLKSIFNFKDFKKGKDEEKLKNWFKNYFNVRQVFLFISGRMALFKILESLNLEKNDEIIIQASTCLVVPLAIKAAGLKPIYTDINNDYTLDINDLKNKITIKTKALIVQHTFGIPSEMDEIKKIANNIILIEDCAHTIGSKYKNKKLGQFGDFAFFSFGRSKAFSAINGGVVIVNNKSFVKNFEKLSEKEKYPSNFWIFKELLHPLFFYFLINPYYNFLNLGKIILVICQKLNILSLEVSKKEKLGNLDFSNFFRMPNVFSKIALNQLSKIKIYNQKRTENVQYYWQELFKSKINPKYENPLLRFPILVDNSRNCLKEARQNKIYLGDWYSNIIDPNGIDFFNIDYKLGTCKNAEAKAKKIINLPTQALLKKEDLKRIIDFIKKYNKIL